MLTVTTRTAAGANIAASNQCPMWLITGTNVPSMARGYPWFVRRNQTAGGAFRLWLIAHLKEWLDKPFSKCKMIELFNNSSK